VSKKPNAATISVRGRAISFAQPDEARCTLSVSAVHPTAQVAIDDVAGRAVTLATVLDGLGIEPFDRFTSAVVVGEHSEYRDGVPVYLGQRAAVQIEVRLRDPSLVGLLLRDAVDRAGAAVEPPRYSVSSDNPAQLEAYRLAARDARRRAEAYAEGLGVKVGDVCAVSEPGVEIAPRFAKSFAGEAGGLPIEVGEMEVAAAVSVTYAIRS
jgi:uncharacterized protein YggE